MTLISKQNHAKCQENFGESDALLCVLNHIFDDLLLSARTFGVGSWRQLPCTSLSALRWNPGKAYNHTAKGLAIPISKFCSAEIIFFHSTNTL